MADFNSKRGDHVKAIQYIERAEKLASEVLDGVKVHKKFRGILDIKQQIYLRKKQYQESLNIIDE